MIFRNPLLHHFSEFFSLGHNLLGLRLSGNKGVIVINHVSLTSRRITARSLSSSFFDVLCR